MENCITSLATDLMGNPTFPIGGAPSLLKEEYLIDSTSEVDNPEYSKLLLDSQDVILWGLRRDGTEYAPDLSSSTMSIVVDAVPVVNYIKKSL